MQLEYKCRYFSDCVFFAATTIFPATALATFTYTCDNQVMKSSHVQQSETVL